MQLQTPLQIQVQLGNNFNSSSLTMLSSALTVKAPNSQIKVKAKKTDNIHFPEFYHAINHTDDLYWKEIFYNSSIKYLPRGFLYADRNLRFRETETYITMPLDPKDFCNTAIYFFQKYGNIYSPTDKIELKKKSEEKIVEALDKKTEQWSVVSKSQTRRASYVRNYVEHFYSQYSKTLRDELFTQINLGFISGYTTKHDITFENNAIQKVEGFVITDKGVEKTRTMVKVKPKSTKKELVKPKVFHHYKNWQKYLNNFEKHIGVMSKASYTFDTKNFNSGAASGNDASEIESESEENFDE